MKQDSSDRAGPKEDLEGQDSHASGRKTKRRKVAEDERKRAIRA